MILFVQVPAPPLPQVDVAHIHPHFLWLFYWLGYLMHILAVAYLTSKSQVNPAKDILDYLKLKWPPIIVRGFVLTLGFVFWKYDPNVVTLLAQHFANNLPNGWIHDLVISVGVPLNPLTAGAYGYCVDSILDKLLGLTPWFKGIVPPLMQQTPPQS